MSRGSAHAVTALTRVSSPSSTAGVLTTGRTKSSHQRSTCDENAKAASSCGCGVLAALSSRTARSSQRAVIRSWSTGYARGCERRFHAHGWAEVGCAACGPTPAGGVLVVMLHPHGQRTWASNLHASHANLDSAVATECRRGALSLWGIAWLVVLGAVCCARDHKPSSDSSTRDAGDSDAADASSPHARDAAGEPDTKDASPDAHDAAARPVDGSTSEPAPGTEAGVGGCASDCDDGNPCTDDDCGAGGVCQNVARTDGTACVDGNACTTDEACQNGVCLPGTVYGCALELTRKSGQPPFDVTARVVDAPPDAQIDWAVDSAQVASGTAPTLSIDGFGEHPVRALVSRAGEPARVLFGSLWGSEPVALVASAVDATGAMLSLVSEDAQFFDGATLEVPPGALAGPTYIEAREWATLQLPGLPVDGTIIELLPHGTTFQTPVSLWLPLHASEEELPCDAVASEVAGYFHGTQLEEFPVAEVDCVARRARIELPHFSFDGFVEHFFSGGEKLIRGICKYADEASEPITYGCAIFGKYVDIYDETKDAIKTAKKQIKVAKTAASILEAYYSGPKYGADEIDRVLGELVDPKRRDAAVNLDSALHDAEWRLQTHQLLVRAPVDREGDVHLALEGLRWFRAEDQRSELTTRFAQYLVDKAFAAGDKLSSRAGLSLIGPLITAQIKTAFNVVRDWNHRATQQQFDHYVRGRQDGGVRWDTDAQRPVVVEHDEYEITDALGHPNLGGWFWHAGAFVGSASFPFRKLNPTLAHWRAFEVLYQLQVADEAQLRGARDNLLQAIAERVEQRRRASAPGWQWLVTNDQNADVVSGSEPDLELHVEMEAGKTLRLDLTRCEGTPETVIVAQREGAPDYARALETESFSGRPGTLSLTPPAPGQYLVRISVFEGVTISHLDVYLDVIALVLPTLSLLSPSPDKQLWADAPFDVEIEANDQPGKTVSFEDIVITDATSTAVLSWHDSVWGNPSTSSKSVKLPAGDYTLTASATSQLIGGLGAGSWTLHVEACTYTGGCSCADQCALGTTECESGAERMCQKGPLGCTEWTAWSACPAAFCTNASACGLCHNTCPGRDATTCSLGVLRTCMADSNDCLAWGAPVMCATGKCIDEMRCDGCGDQSCDAAAGETCGNCPVDCASGCGDSCCLGDETFLSCPADCACVAKTCQDEGWECGTHDDGCGDTLDCGENCMNGAACDSFGRCARAQSLHPFPDTGQLSCFDSSTTLPICPDVEGMYYGQDAQYPQNVQTFESFGDGSVLHVDTGLVWEAAARGPIAWSESACGAVSTGGYADWRVPDTHELLGILDYEHAGEGLDSRYFTTGTSPLYWTIDQDKNNVANGWCVSMSDGTSNRVGKTSLLSLRCVRGSSRCLPACFDKVCGSDGCGSECGYCRMGEVCDPDAQCAPVQAPSVPPTGLEAALFIVLVDGDTVFDNATGLTWQRNLDGVVRTWADASTYCAELSVRGVSGWRLPTAHELIDTVDYRLFQPALDGELFPTGMRNLWASDLDALDSTRRWLLVTASGGTAVAGAAAGNSVRCVHD